jgi:hypothetical protein
VPNPVPTAVVALGLVALHPRPAAAPTGSEFAAAMAGVGDHDRYADTRDQILAGNVPGFLRALVPVELTDGTRTITVFVTPDYVAVGTDDDYLTVPLDLVNAAALAQELGMGLPTPRIVDAVYRAADVRLAPIPLPPGPDMRSIAYVVDHDALIGDERREVAAGELVAGTKKDVVLTPELWAKPDREAIYGWHRSDGDPIQPLCLWHGAHYADYSHGVRLVGGTVLVDGAPRSYFDALADPALAPLLTGEGPIPRAAALLGAVSAL